MLLMSPDLCLNKLLKAPSSWNTNGTWCEKAFLSGATRAVTNGAANNYVLTQIWILWLL